MSETTATSLTKTLVNEQQLATLPPDQPIQLTAGAVQKLIALAVETALGNYRQVQGGKMTIGEVRQWAELVFDTMIPGDSSTNKLPPKVALARACAKVVAGAEWGINAFEAQGLMHFIDNKTTGIAQCLPDYKALLMRIKSAPGCDYRMKTGDDFCTIVAYRNGAVCGETTYTLDMARKAGLYSDDRAEHGVETYTYVKNGVEMKGSKKATVWELHTADMLKSKAARRAFIDHFPDLYAGSEFRGTKEDIEETEIVEEFGVPQTVAVEAAFGESEPEVAAQTNEEFDTAATEEPFVEQMMSDVLREPEPEEDPFVKLVRDLAKNLEESGIDAEDIRDQFLPDGRESFASLTGDEAFEILPGIKAAVDGRKRKGY